MFRKKTHANLIASVFSVALRKNPGYSWSCDYL